jgi:TonB family protein
MAPTTKDAEGSAESPSPTTPVPGAPKTSDGSTRTQPVALEIPVTVNGARTVEGSDKREPFSESTKTVLIFSQGAVIRIATPVAAGQLVFLTNEKSKKEVVCQVVKSKPGGGPGAGYVELQFTEPSAGFWGMRFPAVPAAPTTPPAAVLSPPRPPIPAATRTTPPPNPVPPTSTASAPAPPAAAPPAPPQTPKAAAPALSAPVPPKPAAAGPPQPAAAKSETQAPPTTPPAAQLSFAPPPAPLPPLAPPTPPDEKRGRGIPEVHDYSKEIAAIFAVPPVGSSQAAPNSLAPPAPPASSQPSTEELKRQATRFQVQLGSMPFADSAAAPPASPAATPSANAKSPLTGNPGSAPADSAQKTPELKPPDAKPLPKPGPSAKSKAYDIEQVEEVKVPDWLAPLSRNADSASAAAPTPVPAPAPSEQSRIPGWLSPLSHIAPPAPVPGASSAAAPAAGAGSGEPNASHGLSTLEPEAKSDDVPFGGKMLEESLESGQEASAAGSSKKGLFLGLAAAALLLAGGGVWYMRQTHGINSGTSRAKAVEVPVSGPTVAVNTLPAAKPDSLVPPTATNSSSATLSPVSGQPAKNSTPNAISPQPTTAPKNSALLPRNEPPAEQPKKPSLGEVRLSAPVVKGAADSQSSSEADPALATSVPSPGAESLSSLSANTKEPAAPVQVGGEVKAARLVKSVPPAYPAVARTQRIAGNVSIDAVVDTDGNVNTMNVLSGPAILHRAALDAVKQWHYEPAMLDGKPTASHLTVIVQFRLQ